MSALDALLDTPFAYHLGWTLLHFLWQGLLVACGYGLLRSLMAEATPQARYLLSLGTLVLLAALPIVTFLYLMGTPVEVHAIVGHAGGTRLSLPPPSVSLLDSLREMLHPLVPWTVPAWCVGVALLGFKSLAGWRRARTLTRQASHAAPDAWQQTLAELAEQVGVRIRIRLMVTARVAVPCVVGWLKPVILLPPAALTGLTRLQLEMVLAHELSHIRRHDYLVNLLQVLLETLLFYHPVVRWVSRDARRERELCCDDSAVHACGDALHYAHALADLAALRAVEPSPALGINGGDLAMRVERLITPHHAAGPRFASVMLASALCLTGLLALASARHMPLPLLQSFPLPQMTRSAGVVAPQQHLLPTEVKAVQPAVHPVLLRRAPEPPQASFVPVGLPAAPEMQEPPAQSAVSVAPVDIPGRPIASLAPSKDNTPGFEVSRHAAAPMKFINMNHVDSGPAKPQEHEYCEPITGSRVCGR